MSWKSRFLDWLFPANSGFQESKNRKKSFTKRRESLVRLKLKKRQQELRAEIEKTFKAYEEKLSVLANTLNSLDDEAVKKQSRTLERSQDELKRITKRLEAAVKSTHDLEQELAEWENRQIENTVQNDYAEAVKEIIRSELITRGFQYVVQNSEEQTNYKDAPEPVGSLPKIPEPRIMDLEAESDFFSENNADSLPEINQECLLQAIREATHEAEKWYAEPCGGSDPEAVAQVRHIRDLHAALKALDRKNGNTRDRLAMAVRLKA